MISSHIHAQEIVLDYWHENGNYFNLHNIVEADDNTLLVDCPLFEAYLYGNDIGNMFYKVSLDGEVMDSLIIASSNVPLRTLFEPVPGVKGLYLYGRFEQELSDSTTYARFTFLDRNLNITDGFEVPIVNFLYDFIITSSDLFIDNYGDIIASYWCQQKFYMLRIGIDGSIKSHQEIEAISASLRIHERHTNTYSDSPLLYYYIGSNHSNSEITTYIIDSTFQVIEEHTYDQSYLGGWHEHIVPQRDTYLMSSRGNTPNKCAVLTKYNRGHEEVVEVQFNENTANPSPIWTTCYGNVIYYSYMTDAEWGNRLVLACLDENLNVLWKSYFLEPNMFHWGTSMTVLHDGKVAVGSYKYGQNPGGISVVVIGNDGVGVSDNANDYTCSVFPNPAWQKVTIVGLEATEIQVFNTIGQLVKTVQSSNEIDVSDMVKGFYLLHIIDEKGDNHTKRITVIN